MRYYLFLSVLLLAACKSPEERAANLRTDQWLAQAHYNRWHHIADSVMGHKMPFNVPDSVLDSLNKAQSRLDVANRNFNKFMGR